MDFEKQIFSRLNKLYTPEVAENGVNKLKKLLEKYDYTLSDHRSDYRSWSQEDAILITYGDVICKRDSDLPKLRILDEFLQKYVKESINSVHVLPFFVSSSDSGFSVIDYKKVRNDLGDWNDIEHLANIYWLMADLVINHASRFSVWFKNYEKKKNPGKDYFIEMDPHINLSEVTRPRNSPLLTAVQTVNGLQHVWTTFSDDQIDLDFANPEVLFEFLDIFLFYLSKGVKLIRMDAIAYLWKRVGTSSIHLEETHQVVKLFRDIIEYAAPEVTLITETNVPFHENVSYFGEGDEAHMIYQFSLPPLLLHAILTENSYYLTEWASGLPNPPDGCLYFNFTASHDGIGVRPLEGLVPQKEFNVLVDGARERGGFVSYKKDSNGKQSPYELNITYYSAFAEPGKKNTELQMKRYMCSQILMLSLQGVPGIYFHNLTATRNYLDGVTKTGHKREINRKQWELEELELYLEDEDSSGHKVFREYKRILGIRKKHPAFHPHGAQRVLDLGGHLFAVIRTAPGKGEKILVISNLSSRQTIVFKDKIDVLNRRNDESEGTFTDLLQHQQIRHGETFDLNPFQTVWIKL